MALLQGTSTFCIIDLCQAYLQLLLDDESPILTTLLIHKGFFTFKKNIIWDSNFSRKREMESILKIFMAY